MKSNGGLRKVGIRCSPVFDASLNERFDNAVTSNNETIVLVQMNVEESLQTGLSFPKD